MQHDGTTQPEGGSVNAWPEGYSVIGHLYFIIIIFAQLIFPILQNNMKHTKIWRPNDSADWETF